MKVTHETQIGYHKKNMKINNAIAILNDACDQTGDTGNVQLYAYVLQTP